MDRLDYLRRDSFYTGVAEGEVGVQRLIKTMRVHPLEGGPESAITIEAKGIYAVENFLISRRLMYWQVYLHKTVLAGDQLLRAAFRRVRQLMEAGEPIQTGAPALRFFLGHTIDAEQLDDPTVRRHYCALDDTDVLYSLKRWMEADDPVLADLSRRFINRDFFRVTFLPERPDEAQMEAWRIQVANWLVDAGLSTAATAPADAAHYLTLDFSRHASYESSRNSIGMLSRDGHVRELSEMTDTTTVAEMTQFVEKPYVCYPKAVSLSPAVASLSD